MPEDLNELRSRARNLRLRLRELLDDADTGAGCLTQNAKLLATLADELLIVEYPLTIGCELWRLWHDLPACRATGDGCHPTQRPTLLAAMRGRIALRTPRCRTTWEQEFLQSILQKRLRAQYQARGYSSADCDEVWRSGVNNDSKETAMNRNDPQGSDKEVSDNYDDVDALDEDMSARDNCR
jgi:hypothetical protein